MNNIFLKNDKKSCFTLYFHPIYIKESIKMTFKSELLQSLFKHVEQNGGYRSPNHTPPKSPTSEWEGHQVDNLKARDKQPPSYVQNIQNLPLEILQYIFTFVDEPRLTFKVSKRFKEITVRNCLADLKKIVGENRIRSFYRTRYDHFPIEFFKDIVEEQSIRANLKPDDKVVIESGFKDEFKYNIEKYERIEKFINFKHFLLLAKKLGVATKGFPTQEKVEKVRKRICVKTYLELSEMDLSFKIDWKHTQEFSKNNRFHEIPSEIGLFTNLKVLKLVYNELVNLPEEIDKLTHLQTLHASHNKICVLTPKINGLINLTELDLSHNFIDSLPNEIDNLTNIRNLILRHNHIYTLSIGIGQLTSLKDLDISENNIAELTDCMGNLTNLKTLSAGKNVIENISKSFFNLTNLDSLYLSNNRLKALPEEIGDLKNLSWFDLSSNQLQILPSSITKLMCLSTLILNDNPLIGLPEGLSKKTLRIFGLTKNVDDNIEKNPENKRKFDQKTSKIPDSKHMKQQ